MERQICLFTLVTTALINLAMAVKLYAGTPKYNKYPIYSRTRYLTVIWLVVFAIGYLVHAFFQFYDILPKVTSAVTTSYFHVGAICFSWGFTPLLNPNYLTRKVVVRDLSVFVVSLIFYWTIALSSIDEPVFTILSKTLFYLYCTYAGFTFYKNYNLVSYRMIKITNGSVGSFVRWLQLCCDLIIFFFICSMALTGMFPHEDWPFIVLCWCSPVLFGYIVYSLSNYGNVIEDATKMSNSIHKNV